MLSPLYLNVPPPYSNKRLQFEQKIVARHYPEFHLHFLLNETYFAGSYTTTTSGKHYVIRLDIPIFYPDEMPRLYVINPQTLWENGYKGKINDVGISHSYHTNENGHGGCVQICHTYSWDASHSCLEVLLKAKLWLEAYDKHFKTGMTICEILEKVERRLSCKASVRL